jgi:heme/copper-type cytochrome/quinol oxidase subunit 4
VGSKSTIADLGAAGATLAVAGFILHLCCFFDIANIKPNSSIKTINIINTFILDIILLIDKKYRYFLFVKFDLY